MIAKLDRRLLITVVLAGILATYVMTVAGVWQSGLGLKAMDPSGLMIKSLNKAHPDDPMYGIGYGHLYHYLNGIALALLYAVLFQKLIPTRNWLVHGIVYGIITDLMAAVVIAPLGAGTGIFFSNTPAPFLMTLSSLVAHFAYAGALTFTLFCAGFYADQSRERRATAGEARRP